MAVVNTALNYNAVVFTLCAFFAFFHVAIRKTRFSDDEGRGSFATRLLSSYGSGSVASDNTDEKFVSLCPVNLDGRRLGNQLFNFAAMMYVSRLTGRRVVMPREFARRRDGGWIDRWFHLPAVRLVDGVVPRLCPCRNVTERRPLAFEPSLRRVVLRSRSARTLLTCGWFQSWRYAAGVDGGRSLRRQLRWKPELTTAVRRFLADHRPPNWNATVRYARVGIHVRVGDLLDRRKLAFGYTIPGRSYFRRTIAFFVRHHGKRATRVQFVVTSDDVGWTRTHLRLNRIVARYRPFVDVVYSTSADAGFDLALLSSCDDVIMSTGTYGWWAGWLAAGTTVYHRGWPRRGSPLEAAFDRRDFFPPRWIAL